LGAAGKYDIGFSQGPLIHEVASIARLTAAGKIPEKVSIGFSSAFESEYFQ
jgi:hypothetical protein